MLFRSRQLAALATRLSGPLRVCALGGEELLSHLHACVTGLAQPVQDPGPGVYLDQVLSTQHVTAGWEPVVGSQHLAIVALFHLPGRISPAHLDALNDVSFPFRLSIRFTPLDVRSAQRIIDRYSLGWFWMQRSARDLLLSSSQNVAPPNDPFANRHAVDMLDDAADATHVNQKGEHRFAFFTASIVVAGASRSEANRQAAAIVKILEIGRASCRERV